MGRGTTEQLTDAPRRATTPSKAAQIDRLIDRFANQALSDGYAELARQLHADLSQERPDLLGRRQAPGWAAGILLTIARINFLLDSGEPNSTTADQIAAGVGASNTTVYDRAREVEEALDLHQLDGRYIHPDLVENHPATTAAKYEADFQQIEKLQKIEALEAQGIPIRQIAAEHDRVEVHEYEGEVEIVTFDEEPAPKPIIEL